MNPVFMVAYAALLLLNLISDVNRMRRQHKALKGLYMLLYALSIGLYLCLAFRIELPMPTRFFNNYVSPWVFSIIQP